MSNVVLWCEKGKHEWERLAQKGRRPRNCPRHSGTNPQAEIKIHTEEELSGIESKLSYYIDEYDKLLVKSRGKVDKQFWNHMDAVQMRIINLGRRKKYLESL